MGKPITFHQWLWDLLPKKPAAKTSSLPTPQPARSRRAPARYDQLVEHMKSKHGIRVHRWRKSNSGCAWQVEYRDGTLSRLIESPYPRGPISCAIFLHEIGHHAIGFYRYKPRCYEEYMAWQWALSAMEEHGVSITPRVQKRVDDSLRYAVAKAMRRGIKRLPVELLPYAPDRVRAAHAASST